MLNKIKINKCGFTLIELLVVIAVLGIVSMGTFGIFNRFNQQQSINIAAENLKSDLAQAKSYAISHVDKNEECDLAGNQLLGFQIRRGATDEYYTLEQVCQRPANERVIPMWTEEKKLPKGVRISSITSSNNPNSAIRFKTFQGGSNGGTIVLTSTSGDVSIDVSVQGNIQ